MVGDAAAIGAIVLLAAVTVATRLGGVWLMSFVRLTPRLEAFLQHMAVSVLIAIVVPGTLAAPPRIWLAVAAAALVMIASGSALGAMLVGTALAALARNLAP